MIKNKKVRALLFTLTLAFLAVGTIAIAKEVMKKENLEKVATLELEEWHFKGGPTDNPLLASNYQSAPVTGKPCNNTPQVICKILAPDNGGQPNMTTQVQTDITAANSSKLTNSTVLSFRSN